MRHDLKQVNDEAVLLAYRQALLDGANLKAKHIRDANPDLSVRFDEVDCDD